MSNLNSDTFAIFAAFEKNIVKFSVKIPAAFWHNIPSRVNTFVLHYLIKITQSSAQENTKSNIMCIAIIMTHEWLTLSQIWHCWK